MFSVHVRFVLKGLWAYLTTMHRDVKLVANLAVAMHLKFCLYAHTVHFGGAADVCGRGVLRGSNRLLEFTDLT
jgi:hypothetical protein